MRHIITLFIFILLGISSVAYADIVDPHELLQQKLAELDRTVERRDTYFMRHEHFIDSLKRVAANIKGKHDERALFDIHHKIYNAYKSFQNDSARVYNNRELEIARRIGDKNLIAKAQCDNLFTFMSRGDFTSAVDILNATDLSGVSDTIKADFYVQAVRLYSDLSNFTSAAWDDKYAKLSRAYSDTVLRYAAPGSYDAQFAHNFLDPYKVNTEERISTYESMLRRSDVPASLKAMLHSMLADAFILKGDKELGLAHKAESAIIDIKEATRETTSKHFLAYELYEQGDIDRAARYIHAALEEADAYNAPQRKAEIGRALSLIESTRYKSINNQRYTLGFLLGGAVLIGLIVAVMFFFIRRKNKQLAAGKRTIEEQNAQISEANERLTNLNKELNNVNSKLRESVKIKDEYIGYGFNLNSEYIEKIESIYKLVNRKVSVGQTEDLKSQLKMSDIKEEKAKMLQEIDKSVLRLFPTFIEQYSELFPEDDDTLADVSEGIMTPEMRIFALIRLGISDNNNIARFLNYSVNTINTYKTKAKKRSIVANDEFEERIMHIKSVR